MLYKERDKWNYVKIRQKGNGIFGKIFISWDDINRADSIDDHHMWQLSDRKAFKNKHLKSNFVEINNTFINHDRKK